MLLENKNIKVICKVRSPLPANNPGTEFQESIPRKISQREVEFVKIHEIEN